MPKKTSSSISSLATPLDARGEEVKFEDMPEPAQSKPEDAVESEKPILDLADLGETKTEVEPLPETEVEPDDEKSELTSDHDKEEEEEEKDEKETGKRGNIDLNKYLSKLQRISLRDKIFFTKNLGVMLKAGLSLGKALQALAEQTPNKKFKNILTNVEKKVVKGQSFAEALEKHPKAFSQLFVSMIESGEASGNLEEVLKQLHKQMTRDHALITKVRGAMIYPIIVVTAMVGIGTAMMIFVIPKFISIFEEVQAELPLATRILIGLSHLISGYGLFVALGLIIIITALITYFRTPQGKKILHAFFLKLPILGPIVKKINLARFARTLSSLLKTDIPIVNAFNITAKVLGNIYYKNALLEAAEKIKKGERVYKCLTPYKKLFPAVVIQMVTVGEESGSLDAILEEVANFYEDDVDQTMKNLPTIIEPILMLILGVGVGGMAVAILMPMYSLSQSI